MTILSFVLKFLLVIFILLMLLVCLALFVPFNYIFSGYVNEDISIVGNVNWLFGLIKISSSYNNGDLKFTLKVVKINIDISKLINKHKSSNKQKLSDKHESNKKHFSITNTINSINSNYKKFKDIIPVIKPNYYNIGGYFGFEDPALTGQITAILSTLIHSNNVNLVPIFNEEIIDIKAKLKGIIRGYSICYILLRYFFKNKFTFLSIKVKLFNNKKCIN